MNTETGNKKIHLGRSIKRLREITGVKQEALAIELGITQQAVSALEQKETIDAETLQKIAYILGIPTEVIINFKEDNIINGEYNPAEDSIRINISSNTFEESPIILYSNIDQYKCNINPIEQFTEVYKTRDDLYQQMIKEKNDLIDKLLKK